VIQTYTNKHSTVYSDQLKFSRILCLSTGWPSKQTTATGFASWLRYCPGVTQRTSTKLCTMFGRLLRWYTTFSGALAPNGILPEERQKNHFAPKSSVLLYWQFYCTALEQWASSKVCGVVQGMELRNFRRGRHLYSAWRLSRWASAHILVLGLSLFPTTDFSTSLGRFSRNFVIRRGVSWNILSPIMGVSYVPPKNLKDRNLIFRRFQDPKLTLSAPP